MTGAQVPAAAVEPTGMDVSGLSPVQATQYAVKVEKVAQDNERLEGEALLKLVENAAPDKLPGPAPDGRGRLLDTVA